MLAHGQLLPCIIPVSASFALEWVKGGADDRDLLLDSPLIPEAVFVVDLPDRASYRHLARSVVYWAGQGAVCLICRTHNLTVAKHLMKNGAMMGLTEWTQPVKTRFLLPAEGFKQWVESMKFVTSRQSQ